MSPESKIAALEAALKAQHQPANTTEELLVKQMAQQQWLIQRAVEHLRKDLARKERTMLVRYQTAQEKSLQSSRKLLAKLQKERRKQEIGFVSQKPSPTINFPPMGGNEFQA
jgi:hypothetical protein